MLFLFKLLIFLPFSKLLCQPQNIINIPQSTKDSLMKDTNASQSKVCQGCQKLFSYDPPTMELSDEEFVNTRADTLLEDTVDADVNIVKGNQDSHVISNGTSANALVSTQVWNNFHTNNLIDRSREGLEETKATISEKFGDSRNTNSMTGSFPQKVEREDESYLVKPDRTGSSNPKNFEVSESVMSLYPKQTNSGLEENNLKSYTYAGRSETDHEPLSDVFAGEPHQAIAMSFFPKRTNAELGVNNLKSYAYAESFKTDHEPLSKVLVDDPQHAQVNIAERQASLLSNFEEAGGKGVKYLQYDQPIKIKEETSEINNEATKTTVLNRENYEIFGVPSSLTESLPVLLRSNVNLQENEEMTSSKNTIWAYLNFPKKMHPKVEELQVQRQVNDEWEEEDENSNFPAIVRDIRSIREDIVVSESADSKTESRHVVTNVNGVVLEDPTKWLRSSQENLEVSESTDSTIESSPFVTNVNGVVLEDITKRLRSNQENLEVSERADSTIESLSFVTNANGVVQEDTTKRLKSNRTLNLLQSSRAECEKGGDSCLACREISPNCHYNFRGKMCFYADVVHGNLIYECGIRFIVADGYQPFWIALALLIGLSVVVLFFLARAFYHRILKKDPITDMEVNDMRNIVHLIREKRSMQKKLLKRIGRIRREVVVDELESERLIESEGEE